MVAKGMVGSRLDERLSVWRCRRGAKVGGSKHSRLCERLRVSSKVRARIELGRSRESSLHDKSRCRREVRKVSVGNIDVSSLLCDYQILANAPATAEQQVNLQG